jgi:hypothetical protein
MTGDWVRRREAMTGPFERKRRVPRAPLARAVGVSESDFDLYLYLFSVEVWVLLVARERLLRCVEPNQGSAADTPWPIDLDVPDLGLAPSLFDLLARRVREDDTVKRTTSNNPAYLYSEAIERLVPKQIRHTTGAYFTPPWLADRLVRQVLDTVCLPARVVRGYLEPSCGTGIVLCSLLKELDERRLIDPSAPLTTSQRVVAYELNELWAFVAKVALLELQLSIALERGASTPSLSWHRCVRGEDFLFDANRFAHGSRRSDGQLDLPYEDSYASIQATKRFDVIVGNPPWVNWEYIPEMYRSKIADLWPKLGIFQLRSLDKANSKEDIASLFTIAAMSLYGAQEAVLGFVLPQSLFQSSLLGRGLREATVRKASSLQVLQIDDWSDCNPFGGASNHTVTIVASNQGPTKFPVPWRVHPGPNDKTSHSPIEMLAVPASPDPGAPWLVAPAIEHEMLKLVRGQNPYRARTGVFTGGANAVYYVEPMAVEAGGHVRIRNVIERAKRKAGSVEATIEPAYLYPIVTGRDLSFWSYECSKHLICPHTAETRMSAVLPDELRDQAPLTFNYLDSFREILMDRGGFAGWEKSRLDEAFYAIQRIGVYTFADYKVCWKYIASTFVLAVVGCVNTIYRGTVAPLVNDKIMSISFENKAEAFYVCGILSSYPFRRFVESQMISTQISPSVIKNLCVPLYEPANPIHAEISRFCEEGHSHVMSGELELARKCIDGINRLVFESSGLREMPESAHDDDPMKPRPNR